MKTDRRQNPNNKNKLQILSDAGNGFKNYTNRHTINKIFGSLSSKL